MLLCSTGTKKINKKQLYQLQESFQGDRKWQLMVDQPILPTLETTLISNSTWMRPTAAS